MPCTGKAGVVGVEGAFIEESEALDSMRAGGWGEAVPELVPDVPASGTKLYLTTVASRASEWELLFEWTVL